MLVRWQKRSTCFALTLAVAIMMFTSCSKEAEEVRTAEEAALATDTPGEVVEASPSIRTLVEVPVETPESLDRKVREVISWTPKQADLINSALRGVNRVVMFSDLGLGSQIEFVSPRVGGPEPPVHSLQLYLGREMTALVARFVIDTLPGPRVRGESAMGLIGIHADTLIGRDVVLPRTQSSSGRFELIYLHEALYLQTCCCGIPGTYGIGRYGTFGDTLTAIYVFTPSIGMYTITLAGQEACRTFPGYQYTVFRTERGEFHREVEGYPYLIRSDDSAQVNMYFGRAWRGRKTNLEPMFRVRMF